MTQLRGKTSGWLIQISSGLSSFSIPVSWNGKSLENGKIFIIVFEKLVEQKMKPMFYSMNKKKQFPQVKTLSFNWITAILVSRLDRVLVCAHGLIPLLVRKNFQVLIRFYLLYWKKWWNWKIFLQLFWNRNHSATFKTKFIILEKQSTKFKQF